MSIILNTSRLQIREYRTDDLENYCALLLADNVSKFLGSWVPKNRESVISLFEKDVIGQQKSENRLHYILAIEHLATQELIGNVGFTITENNIADIGWILHELNWGQGFATEATQSVINYAFENNIVTSFIASCNIANKQSERIMQKLGFGLA